MTREGEKLGFQKEYEEQGWSTPSEEWGQIILKNKSLILNLKQKVGLEYPSEQWGWSILENGNLMSF